MTIKDLLAQGGPVIADGGMGTMLIGMGLTQGDAPELWNIERQEQVRSIHRGYVQAGAQIILTNSFGGNRARLGHSQLEARCYELNEAAARLARQEADAAGHPVLVGGSMGPTGQFFEPLGDLNLEAGADLFRDQAAGLVAGGVDVLWIETMADLQEVQAAVMACRQAAPGVPLVLTMTFDTLGRTMMGVTPEQAVVALGEMGASAWGANCGNGPHEIEEVLLKMHTAQPQAPLVAKANAGLPRVEGGRTVYDATPDVMAAYARRVLANGARIIGACCGSTPAHITAIAEALKPTA